LILVFLAFYLYLSSLYFRKIGLIAWTAFH
jgi:hypothetical protein